jgi:cell division transport system ATP-binding protein
MIQFKNVTKKYGGDIIALDDATFTIDKGAFVYLVGQTGSGKTTVFRLIIRDLVPDSGEILIGDTLVNKVSGDKLIKLRRSVGTIFQDLKLLMDHTVMENVILPLQFTGVSEKNARKQAEEILLQVGLADKHSKFPIQLSGGERQRVAIARSLIFNPEILLADEPTGNLDNDTSYQIIDLLQSINKLGTTVLMTTHNKDIIDKAKQRIITMERGKIINDKPAQHIKAEEVKKEAPTEESKNIEKNEIVEESTDKKEEKK